MKTKYVAMQKFEEDDFAKKSENLLITRGQKVLWQDNSVIDCPSKKG